MNDFNLTKEEARRIGWKMSETRIQTYMERTETRNFEIHAIRFLSLENANDLLKLLKINRDTLHQLINFPSYKDFSIPKKKGGTRKISAPAPYLKDAQKTLNYYLQAVYLVRKPECSHGFIIKPKSSPDAFNIVTNAAPHCGKKFVMNIDLEDFFPSISAKRVKDLFAGPQFEFQGDIPAIIALLCTYKRALPAGAPASPVISNFICMEMDNDLMAFCKEKNITYTRYADDLTFSSDTYFDEAIISEIRNAITKHSFIVNEKKFRVQSRQSKQTVTGLLVNKKPNVDRRYIRKLRAIIHHWQIEGLDSAAAKHLNLPGTPNESDRQYFISKMKGSINFVGMVRGKMDAVFLKLNRPLQSYFQLGHIDRQYELGF